MKVDLAEAYGKVDKKIVNSNEHYSRFVALSLLYLKNDDYYLDAGCGNGYLIKALFKAAEKSAIKNLNLHGFDFSDQLVINSKTLNTQATIKKACLPSLDYANEIFDVISLSEVLEHLAQPEKSLIELKRILKNNGKLIISIPNGDRLCIPHVINRRVSWQPADDFFYTYSELNFMLRICGFRIVHVETFGPRFMNPRGKSPFVTTWNIILDWVLDKLGLFEMNRKTILVVAKKDDHYKTDIEYIKRSN
jgi:ubiquinone/menaquinone biosynthesis C-methylase UbiE